MLVGRVTNHVRHIAKLLCVCAVMLLSGCLESDEPVSIQPAEVVRIEGLAGVWKDNSGEQ